MNRNLLMESSSHHRSPAKYRSIEVAPNMYMRLRGADETWQAIHRDFFGPGTCASCSITLYCIQDADFVICPRCSVISPLDQAAAAADDDPTFPPKDPRHIGGVGLGFTFEDLQKWLREEEEEARAAGPAAASYKSDRPFPPREWQEPPDEWVHQEAKFDDVDEDRR